MLDNHRSADFATVEGRSKLKMMRIWNVYCFLCWYEVFFGESSRKLVPRTTIPRTKTQTVDSNMD